jgi:hypothetical protein
MGLGVGLCDTYGQKHIHLNGMDFRNLDILW